MLSRHKFFVSEQADPRADDKDGAPGASTMPSKFARAIDTFADACRITNAQLQLRRRATTPLTVRLQGRAKIGGNGKVVFGTGVSLSGTLVPIEFMTYHGGRIEIGAHTYINYGSSFAADELVSIGAHCHLGHYTFVMDNNQHDIVNHSARPSSKRVHIGDHVWIGSHVVILPGVSIGYRAVIGAGSIVTRSIPPNCLAAGNPARIIRSLKDPV